MGKDFMDYYQEELSKLPKAPSKSTARFSDLKSGPNAEEDPLKGVNQFFDIISRPLYGVTNLVDKTIDGVVDGTARANGLVKDENGKYVRSDNVDRFGGLIDSAMAAFGQTPQQRGAFIEGFTSNSDEHKKTFSDLIEKTTDQAGAADKNYVDVQDNVNPWVKGVAGFAGDVLFDPTNAIPGDPRGGR